MRLGLINVVCVYFQSGNRRRAAEEGLREVPLMDGVGNHIKYDGTDKWNEMPFADLGQDD